jgi:hypothetical protein
MSTRPVLLALATAGFLITACAPAREPARVTVQNMTSEAVADLSIEVSGQRLHVENLRRGESTTLTYSIGAESGYHVAATLQSGKTIEKSVGYVDAGLNAHDLITLHDGDVDFTVLQTRYEEEQRR